MADNFTVGRDGQAVLVAPNGTRIDLGKMTGFHHVSEYDTAQSKPLNGPKQERYLPKGHRVTFELDRRDAAVEAVFAQIEQGWWSVGTSDPGTAPNGSAYFYIQEIDGSLTTHQFRGATMKFGGIGNFQTDSAVKQTIEMHAQYWNKV